MITSLSTHRRLRRQYWGGTSIGMLIDLLIGVAIAALAYPYGIAMNRVRKDLAQNGISATPLKLRTGDNLSNSSS